MHGRAWEVMDYLYKKEVAPHSFLGLSYYETPLYTWSHRKYYLDADGKRGNRTIIYSLNKNPTFSRAKKGYPPALLRDSDFITCFEMLDALKSNKIRPEYIEIHRFECASEFYCFDVCKSKLESLDMYEEEAKFFTDVRNRPKRDLFLLYRAERILYRLKQPQYKPI